VIWGFVQRVVWHYLGAYRVTEEMLDEMLRVIAAGGDL